MWSNENWGAKINECAQKGSVGKLHLGSIWNENGVRVLYWYDYVFHLHGDEDFDRRYGDRSESVSGKEFQMYALHTRYEVRDNDEKIPWAKIVPAWCNLLLLLLVFGIQKVIELQRFCRS